MGRGNEGRGGGGYGASSDEYTTIGRKKGAEKGNGERIRLKIG
jgi:hypothetical protein